MDLSGKVALITGSARRVGRVLALRLADLGCHCVLHCHTSRAEAESLRTAITGKGQEALVLQADLSDEEQARSLADQALAWKGNLHILVNSAANFQRVSLPSIEREQWDFALDANLLGPFWLAQRLGPAMVQNGAGKIINIADISWQAPWVSRIPYCVSKAGLVSLTAGLAKAFAPQVQVNAIGPGPVLFPEEYTEAQRQAVIERNLLKRAGTPEEIADALEFFCRCDFATGVFLPVDGGQSILGI